MRVIYITCHEPAYELSETMSIRIIKIKLKNNLWSGFWRGDWGDQLGQLLKSYYPDTEYECWQPDRRVDRIYEHRFEDGILHKKFPAEMRKNIYGLKIINSTYSKSIIEELNKIKDTYTLIHLGADYNYIGSKIHKIFFSRIPIVSWFLLNTDINNPHYQNAGIFQKLHRYLINKKIRNHIENIKYPVVLNYQSKDVIGKFTDRKIFVMPWAIIDYDFWKCDIDVKNLREEMNIPEGEKIFFSSSRIIDSKQIDKLIEAFIPLKSYSFRLYISGTGPKENLAKLEELIVKNNLGDKIKLLGYVDEITLKKYYLLSDYFISSSLMEGGPTSGLYALAIEKKMIVTDTGYVADALKEFNSGLIIPTTGYDIWTSEIKKVLDGKEVKIIDRNTIKNKFDTGKYFSDLRDIYEKAISDFKKV
jgi:glycosyltransferase involved in cell wall biosynthesis